MANTCKKEIGGIPDSRDLCHSAVSAFFAFINIEIITQHEKVLDGMNLESFKSNLFAASDDATSADTSGWNRNST